LIGQQRLLCGQGGKAAAPSSCLLALAYHLCDVPPTSCLRMFLPVVCAALQRVLGLCLQLLESPSSRPDAQQQHFVEQFVLLVVAAPGMTAAAPAAVQVRCKLQLCSSCRCCTHCLLVRVSAQGPVCDCADLSLCFAYVVVMQARLLQPAVMQQQLLPAATQLAASGRLSGVAALHCLANIAQLLIGCSQRQHQQQQLLTAPSPHLEDSNTAVAYCRAAVQLLSAGTQLRHSKSNGNCSRQRGNSSSNSAGKDRQQAQHRQNSNSSSSSVATEAAGILQDGCWMLGSQQHLLQLLRVLSSGSQEGMVLWAGYCLHLLQDSARISTAAAAAAASGNAAADSSQAAGGSGQLSTAVLNVVAFAPGVLPGVWRWLAVTAGLRLEAPLQASRGLDIAAVARGPEGLQQPVSMVLGLFCRCVAQAWMMLQAGTAGLQTSSRAAVCYDALQADVCRGSFMYSYEPQAPGVTSYSLWCMVMCCFVK
jgi:hypothetical protein